MACDLWLVPLVDVLCHTPDNPFAEELALYDKVLGEAGLPPVPVYAYMPGLSGDVAPVAGFDYDALHFLRRAYLLQMCGLAVTPVDELGGDYEQLLEMFQTNAQQSHLVWHYDHAGAYVPVDFPHPLADDELLAGAARWAPPSRCCASWSSSLLRSASTRPIRRPRRSRRRPPRSWRSRPPPPRTTRVRSPVSGTSGSACTRRRPGAWPRAR